MLSAILLTALLVRSLGLPLRTEACPARTAGIPTRFWMFAAFAVLYGFCETVNGNWSQLDMTSELGASTTQAAIASPRSGPWSRWDGCSSPPSSAGFPSARRTASCRSCWRTFVVIAFLPDDATAAGVVAFGVAGIRLLALLPLTIGFGENSPPYAAVAGGVIAFYQLGYGIAVRGRAAARPRRRCPPSTGSVQSLPSRWIRVVRSGSHGDPAAYEGRGDGAGRSRAETT